MKKFLSGLAMVAVLVVLPTVSFAAEFKAASDNSAVELSKEESAKNLYIAGNTVNVAGVNKSDLVAAGNTLNLSGSVDGDVLAAGNNIDLTGAVKRNARVAGSNITISSAIQEDLFVAGASIVISPEATIGGDLVSGAGTLSVNGPVNGNLKISGGDVTINSKIGGDVVIYGGTLTLGDKANIAGNLTYSSTEMAQISSSAVVAGETEYKKIETKSYDTDEFAGMLGIFGFMGLLMGFALLVVIVYVFPRSSYSLVKRSFGSFWANLGWGFLAFAVAPMALIILAATVIGIKVAMVVLTIYAVMLTVAFTISALAIGSQIVKWIEKKDYRVDWLSALVGVLAVAILGMIPFIGGLITWVIGIVVLGQLLQYAGFFIKNQRRK